MDIKHKRFNRIAGYTLLELMIAMVVGLFLIGGVMFTYLSMKVTTSDTVEMGELQETGRIALDILGKEITMAGFFGRAKADSIAFSEVGAVTAPATDCTEGPNNGSFPNPGVGTNFRVLYGSVVPENSTNALTCIDDAVGGSDVIQIKRASGTDVSGSGTDGNQFYVETTLGSARFVTGGSTAVDLTGTNVWPYNHSVYYVSEQNYTRGDKNISVPVLMRKRLTVSTGIVSESVLEGVENIRFLYGLDQNGNGDVDVYRDATQMTPADWEQSGTTKIKTVQVSVLVRAAEEDANIQLTNKTYVLGGDAAGTQRSLTFTDNYRRMVFVSTFKVNNSGGDQWLIAI
ncbi:PilW family protein [Pseudoalteromonas sp. BDTF-M6]|uniref:PilW family protein n=1 Tax=Pseudoalteromonas sp. BDTF-M6 TaxID=2796132 RepID=UPI001BAF31C1|nr:PilW family protein [Pseudoalteromonas sp. BDTF-M6]MBS3796229.1 PilW family protein [Pseudoalteromonas sp. BDTF-M6]